MILDYVDCVIKTSQRAVGVAWEAIHLQQQVVLPAELFTIDRHRF